MVADLFESGRVVDVILALMVVEAIVLIIIRKYTARGMGPVDIIVSLLAGAALLGALRAALKGAAWPTIAAFLIVALCAHGLDISRRWAAG